jgi:hypothetical protein
VTSVFLAQEFDAVEDGVPYISVNRQRIFTPDTRSRVYGYLGTAPLAAPGFRTDGEWVWPERLAEHVRTQGAAPQEQLYEHMRERWFLLPDAVSEEALWEAARASTGPAVPDPAPWQQWSFFAAYKDVGGPPVELLRTYQQEDGSTGASQYYSDGWDKSHLFRRVQEGTATLTLAAITGRRAAVLNDQLCNDAHAYQLEEGRESQPADGLLRLARVFDGQSPSGAPWFSPGRLRLPEPVRRQRIADYLTRGRLVVRAVGMMADPLTNSDQPVVPLSYRTDGTWVWQEALAYYLRTRGAAPELEFLCHIEERGFVLPTDVPDDVASAAAALAMAAPAPPLERTAMTYYQDPHGVVCRARDDDYFFADAYLVDRRWARASDLADQFVRGEMNEYERISEADAVRTVDARWLRDDAQPPLN